MKSRFVLGLLVCVLCNYAYARDIDTIIIHHTSKHNIDLSSKQISSYHVHIKKWRTIGYHFVIRRNGVLERGRPIEEIGAHALGRNITSIGVALSGNTATDEQLDMLLELIQKLTSEYQIKSIERHHEQCPGLSVPVEQVAKEFLK